MSKPHETGCQRVEFATQRSHHLLLHSPFTIQLTIHNKAVTPRPDIFRIRAGDYFTFQVIKQLKMKTPMYSLLAFSLTGLAIANTPNLVRMPALPHLLAGSSAGRRTGWQPVAVRETHKTKNEKKNAKNMQQYFMLQWQIVWGPPKHKETCTKHVISLFWDQSTHKTND